MKLDWLTSALDWRAPIFWLQAVIIALVFGAAYVVGNWKQIRMPAYTEAFCERAKTGTDQLNKEVCDGLLEP